MEIKNYTMKKWSLLEITSTSQLYEIRKLIDKGYDIGSVDTETSGLHIILDNPFCIPFTLVNIEEKIGKAYVIDLRQFNKDILIILEDIFKNLKKLVFWNAKFDLHMLYNIGMDLVNNDNITDAMIYARLANDAITPDKGGVVLQLKPYSAKYLDSDARHYEHELMLYKKDLKIQRNKELKNHGFKIKEISDFLDDKVNSIMDLPAEAIKIMTDPKYNEHNYNNIPWYILKKYAAFDAIFTIENYLRDYETVRKREQLEIAKKEERLIPILWNMERPGFKLNISYLKQCKYNMKKYILERREDLANMLGCTVKIGQHKLIKQIFKEKYGLDLEKSDKDALSRIKDNRAKEIADIILELRTLEKWYSTYICKWDEYSDRTDRIYTSFKQVGAVSGRFSCDFQQFPKEPIYKNNGELLFYPRRIVMVSGNEYDMLCLIDYAAEELRIQALYTILIGKPDRNLCRAYIPLDTIERDGKRYLMEDPEKEWKPTDLHTLTTLTAFPELTEDHPDFKHFRKIGKSTNFACNYNASVNTLITQFKFEPELANRLYNAYYKAYPNVSKYREYVKDVLRYQDYVTNLFGRRYYNCSWHNASNYLVQGSGADLLKLKLIELNEFFKNNNLKSRILCTIHDEIMYEIHKDEHWIVPKLKEIMEDVPSSQIPIVAEVSLTSTTWDQAKEIK